MTDDEIIVVERALKKLSPNPFTAMRLLSKDIVNLTNLQKQKPLLGDENLTVGYLELALRNLQLYKDYEHLIIGDASWERRILLRAMLYRRSSYRQTEKGKVIEILNPAESYLHIGAAELEIDLLQRQGHHCKRRNNYPALQNNYETFRSCCIGMLIL